MFNKIKGTSFLLALVLLIVPTLSQAQEREQGVIVRPELYGAAAVEFGYQINPNLQLSGGFGLELDPKGETGNFPIMLLGVRAYVSDTKWTAFFDYHLGLVFINGLGLPTHRLTVGPSYKNFDFGGGLGYFILDNTSFIGPCITIGYNFRIGNNH